MGLLTARTNTGGLTGRKLRWAITAVAVTGFSLFGYDQGLMSGIITGPSFNGAFPATEDSVNQGAVTSCYELGCFFGALFAMIRGDKIGRRPLIIAGSLIIILGTVVSVTAYSDHWGLGQFVIGRVVTGVGNGLNTATIPVWQSEISKAKNRGLLVNLEGAVIALGTLIAYWIDFGLSYVESDAQWRFPVAFQIFFAAIVFFGILSLPESPRWMIANHKKEEGMQVLAAINGVSVDDESVELETRVIIESIEAVGHEAGIKDVFTNGRTQHLRRTLIGASGQFFQQLTGCNAAIYYSTVLFEDMGMDRRMSLVMGGVFSIVYTLSTIPSFFMIERVGRRKLFFIGAIGQGCAFLISMGCLVKGTVDNPATKGAVFGIFLFIFFFAWTILPLPWVYPPEINPTKTRTLAASISTCTNWISNFAVVMFTPPFIQKSGWGCYLFFAAMNFCFAPIIFFFYPETAGRSLEEVDIIFAKAYNEKKFSWKVAEELPFLSPEEIEREYELCGLYEGRESSSDEKGRVSQSSEPSSPAAPAAPAAAGDSTNNHDQV